MYSFNYHRPSDLANAIDLIEAGGQALAGGQTLLGSMKLRLAAPEALVDLRALPELTGIKQEDHTLVIGAMTRHCDVAASQLVREHIPALAGLANGIGDKQVRAMGTIGGSLANNDPAADYPAAVLGLGATIQTPGRTITADKFFQSMFGTALEMGELITSVHFPIPKRAAYVKFNQPASLFALIGVFVAQFEDGVRVAVTGGGNGVFRHKAMEEALQGDFSAQAIAAIDTSEENLSSDIHGSSAYRAHLVGVMAQRAVAQALAQG